MLKIIPDAYPLQTLQVTLGGVDCLLTLDWQTRSAHWRVSLALVDGTPLVEGVKVTLYTDLLARCVDPKRPVGALVVLPRSATLWDTPGINDWDVRHDLVWLDPVDVAELNAGGTVI